MSDSKEQPDSVDGSDSSRCYAGMPVIRSGDTVYIINNMPDPLSRKSMMEQAERMMLRFDDYRCPFDFLAEFDQWFEWKKREHFGKQSTGTIMCSMVSDIERIKAHKIERRFEFRANMDFGLGIGGFPSRLLVTSSA